MTVLQESDTTYREWAPPPAWRAVVTCCWEQYVALERTQRVLPDGCADILFHASGEAEVVGSNEVRRLSGTTPTALLAERGVAS